MLKFNQSINNTNSYAENNLLNKNKKKKKSTNGGGYSGNGS